MRILTRGNEQIDYPILIEDYVDKDSKHNDMHDDEQNVEREQIGVHDNRIIVEREGRS